MGRDPNTPSWVQHIAFQREGPRRRCSSTRRTSEANGVEVLGVTDHGVFHSIYFFDPNGHRVELACPDPDEDGACSRKLDAVKWDMLEEWSQDQARAEARGLPARAGVRSA